MPQDIEPTEAQFEAQLRAAILKALPWLPPKEITHQTSFSFKLGHADILVDGATRSNARGRVDVLVSFKKKPLAIFELKRPGVKLKKEDDEQGLSYARILHPRPPLVIISNSETTRILETQTGDQWNSESMSEVALADLIERSTSVAQADLNAAVETLMGTNPAIWVQAIRQTSRSAIQDVTGHWTDMLCPFVDGFMIPRKITCDLISLLEKRERLLILEGDPMSGKSNILREIEVNTHYHDELVTLYIDSDTDLDLFERIAEILSDSLSWPVSREQARLWVKNISRANGPILVLAVDNIGPDHSELKKSVQDVTSNQFGLGVRVLLAVDDAIARKLVETRNRRSTSPIGQRAVRKILRDLDSDEFGRAYSILVKQRLAFVKGAEHIGELRKPWLIRSIVANAVQSPKYQEDKLYAALSPVPSLEILHHARERFDASQEPFSTYRELAQATLAEIQDSECSGELVLQRLTAFVLRKSTVRKFVPESAIEQLKEQGLLGESRAHSGENIYVVRLPELLACELSDLVTTELIKHSQNTPEASVDLLVRVASNLPLGDVIAAEALLNAAVKNCGLNIEVIALLRGRTPQPQTLPPGTQASAYLPDIGIVKFTIMDDGSLIVEHNGRQFTANADPEELVGTNSYSDTHPYQILSHLAGYPIRVIGDTGPANPRLDPDLLLGVGAIPHIMRRPETDPSLNGVYVHEYEGDLTIACHTAGIIEPITWSLARFFGREEEEMRDQFIQEALLSNAPALLARVDIALSYVASTKGPEAGAWAQDVRKSQLKPLLEKTLPGFLHS